MASRSRSSVVVEATPDVVEATPEGTQSCPKTLELPQHLPRSPLFRAKPAQIYSNHLNTHTHTLESALGELGRALQELGRSADRRGMLAAHMFAIGKADEPAVPFQRVRVRYGV